MTIKFERELAKAIDKAVKASEKAIQETLRATFRNTIRDTPVGDPTFWKYTPSNAYKEGTLRGNWQTTLNAPATAFIKRRQSVDRGAALNEVNTTINKWNINTEVYFTNNAPYAARVNGGYIVNPKFSPYFVEKNAEMFDRILKQKARTYRI